MRLISLMKAVFPDFENLRYENFSSCVYSTCCSSKALDSQLIKAWLPLRLMPQTKMTFGFCDACWVWSCAMILGQGVLGIYREGWGLVRSAVCLGDLARGVARNQG